MRVLLRLPLSDCEDLDLLAEREGTTRSGALRMAVLVGAGWSMADVRTLDAHMQAHHREHLASAAARGSAAAESALQEGPKASTQKSVSDTQVVRLTLPDTSWATVRRQLGARPDEKWSASTRSNVLRNAARTGLTILDNPDL